MEAQLASPDVLVSDLAKLGKEYSSLAQLVTMSDQRHALVANIKDLKSVEDEERKNGAAGAEMLQLAQMERADVENSLNEIESEIIKVLTPKDEADERGVIIEVRAGTGKQEMSTFSYVVH